MSIRCISSGLAGGGAPVAELLAVDLGDALPLLLRVHDLDSIRVWLETWEAQGGAYGSATDRGRWYGPRGPVADMAAR